MKIFSAFDRTNFLQTAIWNSIRMECNNALLTSLDDTVLRSITYIFYPGQGKFLDFCREEFSVSIIFDDV